MRTLGRKQITLIIAVAMVLFVSVSATLAYFSDYDTAQGEKTLVLSGQTTIEQAAILRWQQETAQRSGLPNCSNFDF